MVALALDFFSSIGTAFELTPFSSPYGRWQRASLVSAIAGTVSAIALGVLKDGVVVLGMVTTVISLAGAYAFRRVYILEEERRVAQALENTTKEQLEDNEVQKEILTELRDQNNELQKNIQSREGEIKKLQSSLAEMGKKSEQLEKKIKEFETAQRKENEADAKLSREMKDMSSQLAPLADLLTQSQGPLSDQLKASFQSADGQLKIDLQQVKGAIQLLQTALRSSQQENERLTALLTKQPDHQAAADSLKKTLEKAQQVLDETQTNNEETLGYLKTLLGED